jgi:hypothetical protein
MRLRTSPWDRALSQTSRRSSITAPIAARTNPVRNSRHSAQTITLSQTKRRIRRTRRNPGQRRVSYSANRTFHLKSSTIKFSPSPRLVLISPASASTKGRYSKSASYSETMISLTYVTPSSQNTENLPKPQRPNIRITSEQKQPGLF